MKHWKLSLKDKGGKKLEVGVNLFYDLTKREVRVLLLAVDLDPLNLFSLRNKRSIQKEMAYKNVTGVNAVVNVIKQKGAIVYKTDPRRYELSPALQAFIKADAHTFEWEKV